MKKTNDHAEPTKDEREKKEKVFTFVYIFHPLIVIFRGVSIVSTDILVKDR